jgi:hypothetical protein
MVRTVALIVISLICIPVQATELCAFPGRDGHSHAEDVVNLWLASAEESVLEPGTRWLPVSGVRRGRGGMLPGDLALLVQMQGAEIVSANDHRYGGGLASQQHPRGWQQLQAGHFEFVRIEEEQAGRIRVRGAGAGGGIVHRYISREPQQASDQGRHRWQLVRVPQYEQLTLSGDLRALPWDGATGGILALDVRRDLDLNGYQLDAAAIGFRGGAALTLVGALGDDQDVRYRAPGNAELAAAFGQHASKGEGLAGTPRWLAGVLLAMDTRPEADRLTLSDGYPDGSMARGAPANAGGGASSLSADNLVAAGGGGGGGGLAGETGTDAFAVRRGGVGGEGVPMDEPLMVFGGGGGAGTRSQGDGIVGSGGVGGGMIIIRAGRLHGEGVLDLRGQDGLEGEEGGGGGGGGGGSLLLQVPFADQQQRSVHIQGGAGGQAPAPGGAGGRGRILLTSEALQGGMPEGTADIIDEQALPGVGAGYLCRPTGMLLSGRIFEDNGAGGGLAHDGRWQRGEQGLAGLAVQVRDGTNVLAHTVTNRAGLFVLELPEQLAERELDLRVVVPNGWHAVSARANDLPLARFRWMGEGQWRFTVRREYLQSGIALALVREPQWVAPTPREVSPGSTQLFLFRYLPHTEGRVRFHYRGEHAGMAQWPHRFLLDPECNEASRFLDAGVSRWLRVVPGQPVCVRVRVDVPADAPRGDALILSLEAETDLGSTPLGLQLPVMPARIQLYLAP